MPSQPEERPPVVGSAGGDLKLRANDLNRRGARIYIRILCPILLIFGIILVPVAIALLASVGTVDGPHTSTAPLIYWTVAYVWVLLCAILLIYVGIQLPRYGVVLSSESLTIRGFRTKAVPRENIGTIDIGESRMLRQPTIVPILVMRDGERIPVTALSIRSAPLSPSPTPPIDRLRPMVEELRSRIGVGGIEEDLPHFRIR
jgi:hypothetical protein